MKGRIFGITVRVHYSTWINVLLMTWSLAEQFAYQYPNWSVGKRWVLGVIVSILLFTSVLAHELAHSVVAQAKGIRVKDITLMFFGGAAQIIEEPREALAELLMTGVGPLTNGVIAGFCLLLWLIRPSQFLAALGIHLAYYNLAMGVFNLLFGFPMDGGRLLRSVIWQATDDPHLATLVALRTGNLASVFLITLGVWEFFNPPVMGGFMYIFMGIILLLVQVAYETHYKEKEGGKKKGGHKMRKKKRDKKAVSKSPNRDRGISRRAVVTVTVAILIILCLGVAAGVFLLGHEYRLLDLIHFGDIDVGRIAIIDVQILGIDAKGEVILKLAWNSRPTNPLKEVYHVLFWKEGENPALLFIWNKPHVYYALEKDMYEPGVHYIRVRRWPSGHISEDISIDFPPLGELKELTAKEMGYMEEVRYWPPYAEIQAKLVPYLDGEDKVQVQYFWYAPPLEEDEFWWLWSMWEFDEDWDYVPPPWEQNSVVMHYDDPSSYLGEDQDCMPIFFKAERLVKLDFLALRLGQETQVTEFCLPRAEDVGR